MARSGDGIQRRGDSWWLDFRHDGRRHQVRLGSGINKTTARELAQVKRTAILKGEAGIGRKKKDVSFDEAKKLFLEWADANKKPLTARFYRDCLARLEEEFRGKRLSQITAFSVEGYRRRRIQGGAAVRVNREMATLRAMVNRMIEWGRFEGANPAKKKTPPELQRRARFFSEEEERRLLEACAEPLRTVVLTCIHAGLRMKAEALTLRWGAVDLVQRKIHVEAAYAKSSKMRSIPINSTLLPALAALRPAAPTPEAPVFVGVRGEPLRDIRSSFERACKRAGIAGATPHTCRHTFASRLVMAGVDLRTVQELGGWATLRMVERYSHLSPSHLADAVEKLATGQNPIHFTTLFTTPASPAKKPAKETTGTPSIKAV